MLRRRAAAPLCSSRACISRAPTSLKSGTHFQIDAGVELRGIQDLSGYPIMPTRVAGIEMEWPAALINVYEQSDVSISGKGIVDGDGKVWWDQYWKMRREDYEPKGIRWAADYDCRRPRLIEIYKSSGVKLEELTLKRRFRMFIRHSDEVTVDGITIRNNEGGHGPSTDGIDIDSSNNVLVQRCDIDCNDDAICLKAGRDADGLRVNRPSEKVVIRDNTVRGGAAGVTFGSGWWDSRCRSRSPACADGRAQWHPFQVGKHARGDHPGHQYPRRGYAGCGLGFQRAVQLESELQLTRRSPTG